MAEFNYLQNPISKKWVVLAPRRAKRPDVAKGTEPVCPFCLGREGEEREVYRVPPLPVIPNSFRDLTRNQEMLKQVQHDSGDWLVRVVPNKFPFAPIHEIVIHSPDHHKNFGELPLGQVELIFKTYRERFNTHKNKGQVYIFHNRGEAAGESLPHPHTQLAVMPKGVELDMPVLESVVPSKSEIRSTKSERTSDVQTNSNDKNSNDKNASPSPVPSPLEGEGWGEGEVSNFEFRYSSFSIFCPVTSQWPDEVWIAPKKRHRLFGEITDEEITDLSFLLTKLIKIFGLRYGAEFPFNFYIYPGIDWYLRVIPRSKVLGGFEIGTGIFINTEDPKETIEFIKEHF